jgi:hypothetical protein
MRSSALPNRTRAAPIQKEVMACLSPLQAELENVCQALPCHGYKLPRIATGRHAGPSPAVGPHTIGCSGPVASRKRPVILTRVCSAGGRFAAAASTRGGALDGAIGGTERDCIPLLSRAGSVTWSLLLSARRVYGLFASAARRSPGATWVVEKQRRDRSARLIEGQKSRSR